MRRESSEEGKVTAVNKQSLAAGTDGATVPALTTR